jgi:uncharacterized protein (TIGR02117 family)
LATVAALAFAFPAPARDLPAPSPGDCVEIALWSNGFHTSISIPTAMLGDDHPLRRALPEAAYLLVGWGDEGYYRHGGIWRGASALIPPSPTVIHLIGADQPVEGFYQASRVQRVALSGAQATGLAAFLAGETATDAAGAPIFVSQGHAGPNSVFIRSDSHFHGLNVCNHWTARALRAAGLEVGSRLSFRADGVLAAAARAAPSACPAA